MTKEDIEMSIVEKDKVALEKILWEGSYYVDGVGYDIRKDNEPLPIGRFHCHKCVDKEDLIFPIAKIFLRNGKKGVVCRCHKCGNIIVKPMTAFVKKKEVHLPPLDFSNEARHRRMMQFVGKSQEEIDAECENLKDEFAKKDRADKIREKNFWADMRAEAKANKRDKENSEFKSRLDSGEIKYDAKARAFYEVATGKVVRKL